MFTHLSLVFLLQSVKSVLVGVEVVVVSLVGKASQDLSRRVIEVSWAAIGIKTFALIASFLSTRATSTTAEVASGCRVLVLWLRWGDRRTGVNRGVILVLGWGVLSRGAVCLLRIDFGK